MNNRSGDDCGRFSLRRGLCIFLCDGGGDAGEPGE